MVLVTSTNSLYTTSAMLKILKPFFIAVNIPSAKQCNSYLMYSLKVSPLHIPIFVYLYRCITQAIVHLLLPISINGCPLYLLESLSKIDGLMLWLRILMLHSFYQHSNPFFFLQYNMLASIYFYFSPFFGLIQTASPMPSPG